MLAIAFDYGGTLRVDDGRFALRELVHFLGSAGARVHIISAVGCGTEAGMRQQIEDLGLPLSSIEFVIMERGDIPSALYREDIGRRKAELALKLGCAMLIDDDPAVCRGARKAGLMALCFND